MKNACKIGTPIHISRFHESKIDLNSSKNSFRSSRENYRDAAIGYVCLKRENPKCTIRVRICPEHRVKQKDYTVII